MGENILEFLDDVLLVCVNIILMFFAIAVTLVALSAIISISKSLWGVL